MRPNPILPIRPSRAMPGRYLNVRVPPPFIASTISGGYPCSRRRRAPDSPEYRSAILIHDLATYDPIVSQDTRSMSSSPRLLNRYLLFTSGASSGQPSSTHCFHPLRSIGPFRRYGPYTRRWNVYPFRHIPGFHANVPRLPDRASYLCWPSFCSTRITTPLRTNTRTRQPCATFGEQM